MGTCYSDPYEVKFKRQFKLIMSELNLAPNSVLRYDDLSLIYSKLYKALLI